MDLDGIMLRGIISDALPFLIVLVVFGAPVLYAYLRWSFKLREKELDLQRELALRGVGRNGGDSPEFVPARLRVGGGAPGPNRVEADLVVTDPEARAERLLAPPNAAELGSAETANGGRLKA
jgi:hypothetical protein